MTRVYYNKLIRDRIKDKIHARHGQCEVRVIESDEEYEQELLKKIKEEAEGLAHAKTRAEFLSEYADLMVVLDALTAQLEISEAELQVAMTENVEKKGLFKLRHFLHWSSKDDYQSNETPQGVK